jgi:HEAT repeat protein
MPRWKVLSIIATISLLMPTIASAQAPSVQEYIKALQSGDAAGQVRAARALGNLGSEAAPAVDALVAALASDEAEVESAAALALAAIGPLAKGAVAALVQELKDEDAAVRARAAYALGKIDDSSESTVTALIEAALDTDLMVRRAVRDALRAIEAPRDKTMPIWIETLKSAEPQLVMPALLTLAELGPEAVDIVRDVLKNEEACYWGTLIAAELGPDGAELTPELVGVLKHNDPECRMHALFALGEIGPGAKNASATVVSLLENDEFDSVKYAAAYALSEIDKSDNAKAALAKLLDSSDTGLACIAGRGLMRMDPAGQHDERAEKAVIAGLNSKDEDIRQLAVRTLAESTPDDRPAKPAVVDAFVAAMEDADPAVIEEVIDALAAQGTHAVGRISRGLANEKLRPIAVQVAIRMGADAKGTVPALLEAIDATKEDPLLRREIHFALAAIGPDAAAAVPKLTEALGDEVPEIRYSACYALGRIGPSAESCVQAISKLYSSDKEDDFQRLSCLWALVHIYPNNEKIQNRAIPVFTEALSDSREHVRAEVANALGDIGPAAKSALPALRQATKDEFAEVREAAKAAIEQISK